MRDTTVVRLVGDRLAWYPPGAGTEPRWLDNEGVLEQLAAALSQRRIRACFAVPGEDARLLTVPVAPEEKKHLSRSLPFSLEEQVATDVEDLHFAYCPLSDTEYGVAIVAHEKMAAWQTIIESLPDMASWLPEPLLLPWQTGEWCLAVEDAKVIARTGQCDGFTLEPAMVDPVLQGVLRDSNHPQAIVVYGTDQDADIALVPAEFRDRVQWRQGGLCAALMLSESVEPNLNLLQGHYAPRLPLGLWWRQWRLVAMAFAAAFILQVSATYAEYRGLSQQNLAMRSAMETSYRSAFPRGAVVDVEKQLRRQLDSMGGSGEGSGFVRLLNTVGAAINTLPGTTITTVNYNDKSDEMRLNIGARDFDAVEKLRSRINDAGLEAVMESSNTRGDRVSARLRVKDRS